MVRLYEQEPDFQQGLYELNLQRVIQACRDLANVVIAKEGLGLPNSYRQSFEIFEKHAVIPQEVGSAAEGPVGPLFREPKARSCGSVMAAMIGFRNISVHDYERIKPGIVQSIVAKHLVDFEVFYTLIYNRVQGW